MFYVEKRAFADDRKSQAMVTFVASFVTLGMSSVSESAFEELLAVHRVYPSNPPPFVYYTPDYIFGYITLSNIFFELACWSVKGVFRKFCYSSLSMPSQGAGSSPNRPRRAKSTSSIKSRQTISVASDNIDPHALTAAALAFERANGRATAYRSSPERESTATSSADKPPLVRKQSVRFVGPKAQPTRQRSITRREAPDYKSNIEHSHMGPMEEEYFDSEVASIPSSYKRIRKSKSMYSPRKARSFQFTHGTPGAGFHTRSRSERSSDSFIRLSDLPKPNLRRSFSFLRGKSDHLSSNARQNVSTDAAVQMARDQYFRQLEQQRLDAQPSVLTLGKYNKPPKGFRRTVRTSSTNSYGSAIASTTDTAEPTTARGLGDRARSISFSLKSKLKRVFHRPSSTQEGMPAQQLDAKRPHFGDYKGTASGLEERYEGIPSPDGETLRRINSRESPFKNSHVLIDRASPAGSIRSMQSGDSSKCKSRVTSWTDSTATNTLSSRQRREKKRLSVIQENGGPHQPSSSVRQYGELADGYTVFRKPIRNNSVAGRARGLVDSQRIYSALQRRLGDKGRQAQDELDPNAANASDQTRFHLSDLTPRRSSINSLRDTPDSLEVMNTKHTPDSPHGVKFSKSVVFKPLRSTDADDVFSSPHEIASQKAFVGLTPQDVAQCNEVDHPTSKRPVREVKSGFFPSNMRLERSKTSPFRRVMHVGRASQVDTEADLQSPEHPGTSSTSQPRPTIYGFHNGSMTGSESVYSRTSGGNTPKPTESTFSLAKSEGSGEVGTAFMITSQSGEYREPRRPFTQRNLSSPKSSGDWQNWMASQVATLESRGTENNKKYDAYPIREIGHKRENAQLDDEDLALGKLPNSINAPKQPLAVVHHNMMTRPMLERKASYSMIDRFPLLDISPASNVSTPKQYKAASSDLNTGQARHDSNVENERYPSSINRPYASSSDLRKKVSSASLNSQRNGSTPQRYQSKGTISPDSEGTPISASGQGKFGNKSKPKTPSRHSPERLARLRRMQSSTSPGLFSTGESQPGPAQPHDQKKPPDIQEYSPTNFCFKDLDSGANHSSPPTDDTPVASAQRMVDLFLSKRRRNLKSSQHNCGDPAFL